MEKACEQNRFKNKQDGKPDMVRASHMHMPTLCTASLWRLHNIKKARANALTGIHACLSAVTVSSSVM